MEEKSLLQQEQQLLDEGVPEAHLNQMYPQQIVRLHPDACLCNQCAPGEDDYSTCSGCGERVHYTEVHACGLQRLDTKNYTFEFDRESGVLSICTSGRRMAMSGEEAHKLFVWLHDNHRQTLYEMAHGHEESKQVQTPESDLADIDDLAASDSYAMDPRKVQEAKILLRFHSRHAAEPSPYAGTYSEE